jgi:hypothetical protein
VPPTFEQWIEHFYVQLGQPTVNRDNVWDIYSQLLNQFVVLDHIPFDPLWVQKSLDDNPTLPAHIELVPGLVELQEGLDGHYYMGAMEAQASVSLPITLQRFVF